MHLQKNGKLKLEPDEFEIELINEEHQESWSDRMRRLEYF